MPSYRDWIDKIDIEIDYFSAFIKAWIAFNSWYRSQFSEKRDREVIESIKSQTNRFRGYIETLLDTSNSDEDATAFRHNLLLLQSALVKATIFTQERGGVSRQVTFSEIAINNPKSVSEGDYRNKHYKIHRIAGKVVTLITNKDDNSIVYFEFEQEFYDETALDIHADFQKMNKESQGQCKALYHEINPYVNESVLTRDSDNNNVFIAERDKVSRGIVEVLYLLRCSLMHGEVSPDNSSNEVYKYAYAVLAAILKKLL